MPAGGCFCGKVRYEVADTSGGTILCHCLDCRKISGGAFSTNIVAPSDGFKVTEGTPKSIDKTADTGKTISSKFCGDCGSTMWRDGDSFPGKVIVKAGTLDEPEILNESKIGAELFAPTRPKWMSAQEGAAQMKNMS
ncbi:hypothetical protein IQ07DRAFT_315994 [Pyrenochaeta sp. DS3sAY3a]|nr:hypothetical protein IQ07DRAFT_315994 [Pyrenochaeta sp. DS3sAY3a]